MPGAGGAGHRNGPQREGGGAWQAWGLWRRQVPLSHYPGGGESAGVRVRIERPYGQARSGLE